MRILVIAPCPFPWPRGTPVRIHRLSEALHQRGHHIDVAAYPLGDNTQPLPFQVRRSIAVPYYRKTSPGPSLTKLSVLDPLLLCTVFNMLRARPYDLIHAHHIEALLICRWLRYLGIRMPVVYDAHTRIGEELASYLPAAVASLSRRIGHWLDVRLTSKADCIITVTQELRDFFVRHGCLNDRLVITVMNGIEGAFIDQAERACRLSETSARHDGIDIVFAGNLTGYQRIELLLNSFFHVRRMLPAARLRLLTQDNFSPYLPQVEALGLSDAVSVEPVDFSDLPAALASAHVLVNPRTVCSGMPQKLLNYMGSGRPIVSFAGSARLVRHRDSALIVENDDVQAFADAVIELVKSPQLARALAERARRLVRDHYSWDAAAERVERIYQSVLNSGNHL